MNILLNIMCPRGEIGRHKGLKSLGIHKLHCLRQSQVVSKHYQSSSYYLALQLTL
jgi:hypothetical protein